MLMALCACTIIRCLFSFLCLCFCFLWEASCSIYSGTAPTGGGLLANLGKVRPSRKCFWRPFRDGGLWRIGSRSIDFAMACWRNWKLNGEFLLVPMRRVVVWETGCCRAVCLVTAESDALWDVVLRLEVKINNHLQRKGNVIIQDHWTWEKLLLLRSWALVRFHGRVCLLVFLKSVHQHGRHLFRNAVRTLALRASDWCWSTSTIVEAMNSRLVEETLCSLPCEGRSVRSNLVSYLLFSRVVLKWKRVLTLHKYESSCYFILHKLMSNVSSFSCNSGECGLRIEALHSATLYIVSHQIWSLIPRESLVDWKNSIVTNCMPSRHTNTVLLEALKHLQYHHPIRHVLVLLWPFTSTLHGGEALTYLFQQPGTFGKTWINVNIEEITIYIEDGKWLP